MSAESQVESIIANAKAAANIAETKAITYSDQAITASVSIIDLGDVPNPDEPSVEIPPFINPDQDLGNEFKLEIAAAFADLDPKLTDDINDFLNMWFPNFAACLQTSVDNWICDTITTGADGIPVVVENAIWNRSREKELQDAYRRESEAITEFSGRGFSLPAGVLLIQLDAIRQDVANKVATSSREQAIKQAEIQIDTIKFAIEQGVKMRLGVVAALIDFMRAKLGLYSLIKERAVSFVEAKRSLWQAAAAYYQALVAAEGLHLEWEKLRSDTAVKMNEIFANFVNNNTRSRVQAALGAANAMGDIAAAALGAQNTLADIGHNTIKT